MAAEMKVTDGMLFEKVEGRWTKVESPLARAISAMNQLTNEEIAMALKLLSMYRKPT